MYRCNAPTGSVFFSFSTKVDVYVCVAKINIRKYVMQVSNEEGEGQGVVREAIPTNQAPKHVIKTS
jgi:hypothetical protein